MKKIIGSTVITLALSSCETAQGDMNGVGKVRAHRNGGQRPVRGQPI